jgi:hypothetical protein
MYLKISAMNEVFNPKVGLRALFSGPQWLAPYLYHTDPQVEVQIRILLKDKYRKSGNPTLISQKMTVRFVIFKETTR